MTSINACFILVSSLLLLSRLNKKYVGGFTKGLMRFFVSQFMFTSEILAIRSVNCGLNCEIAAIYPMISSFTSLVYVFLNFLMVLCCDSARALNIIFIIACFISQLVGLYYNIVAFNSYYIVIYSMRLFDFIIIPRL